MNENLKLILTIMVIALVSALLPKDFGGPILGLGIVMVTANFPDKSGVVSKFGIVLGVWFIVCGLLPKVGQAGQEWATASMMEWFGSSATARAKEAFIDSKRAEAGRLAAISQEYTQWLRSRTPDPSVPASASTTPPSEKEVKQKKADLEKKYGASPDDAKTQFEAIDRELGVVPPSRHQRSQAVPETSGSSGYATAANHRYPADWPVDGCNGTPWPSARCELERGGIWYKTGLYLRPGEHEYAKVVQSRAYGALKRLGKPIPVDGIERDKTGPFDGLPRGCIIFRIGNSPVARQLFSLEAIRKQGKSEAQGFPTIQALPQEEGPVFLAINEWPEDADNGTGATTVYLEREAVEKIHPDLTTLIPDKDNHKKSKSS